MLMPADVPSVRVLALVATVTGPFIVPRKVRPSSATLPPRVSAAALGALIVASNWPVLPAAGAVPPQSAATFIVVVLAFVSVAACAPTVAAKNNAPARRETEMRAAFLRDKTCA